MLTKSALSAQHGLRRHQRSFPRVAPNVVASNEADDAGVVSSFRAYPECHRGDDKTAHRKFRRLMSPSGNGRKSLAFRRSLQIDHPLLPHEQTDKRVWPSDVHGYELERVGAEAHAEIAGEARQARSGDERQHASQGYRKVLTERIGSREKDEYSKNDRKLPYGPELTMQVSAGPLANRIGYDCHRSRPAFSGQHGSRVLGP
jgi:hypothetical protein